MSAPMYPHRLNDKGVAFIAEFEGLAQSAYHLKGEAHWTIGYGHYGPDVHQGMRITQRRALELLAEDVREFERAVVREVPRRHRRWPHNFAALVSCAFNLGAGVLTPEQPLTSLGEALRARRSTKATRARIAAAIRLYDVDSRGVELAGLVRRRRCEARLYTTGHYSTEA